MEHTDRQNLQPHSIIGKYYEVLRHLGRGSRGTVYLCRDLRLEGRCVVLKILMSGVAKDEVEVARFQEEILALYDINHPCVVRAYEFIRETDMLAMAMEYVQGGDLGHLLNTGERLPIIQVKRMLTQIVSGVQAIHVSGLVHHDLKPENILLTGEGDVKLSDFGISRITMEQEMNEQGEDILFGTVYYLSPEYIEFSKFDHRSDIYSIGVIGYELITNTIPFLDQNLVKTLKNRLRKDPPSVHELRPDCPLPLSEVIMRAMARNPNDRYQSADEMLIDLMSCDAEPDYADEEASYEPQVEVYRQSYTDTKTCKIKASAGLPVADPYVSVFTHEGDGYARPASHTPRPDEIQRGEYLTVGFIIGICLVTFIVGLGLIYLVMQSTFLSDVQEWYREDIPPAMEEVEEAYDQIMRNIRKHLK